MNVTTVQPWTWRAACAPTAWQWWCPMVVMVSSDGQADRTTSSPHSGHGVVRTAWSLEAGQLDAVPPRATPKSVKHCLTPLNIVIHMSVTVLPQYPPPHCESDGGRSGSREGLFIMLFRPSPPLGHVSSRLVRDEEGTSPPRSNEGPAGITLAPLMLSCGDPSRAPCDTGETWCLSRSLARSRAPGRRTCRRRSNQRCGAPSGTCLHARPHK